MIEKIKQEGKIDIYHFVSQMRRERHLMVQTVVCLFHLFLHVNNPFISALRNNMCSSIELFWNIFSMEIRESKEIFFNQSIPSSKVMKIFYLRNIM